jgi:HD-like signal output (HDOD) protein
MTAPVRQRVLFVDDEQPILDGLQNLLRKDRARWEMVFVDGAEAALRALEVGPFDVVVTDMRMPGMDGAGLLAEVKERFPAMARIVLSGHAEREAVLRAIPAAHQYLSKPCDAAALRVAIERTCELKRLLTDPATRGVIGALRTLPSVPRTYTALTEAAAANSHVTIAEIAAIIESDPAMSVKVLQLANSAYFGLARRVASIRQAVTYLGLDLLKGLALTSEVFSAMEERPVAGFSIDELQAHSVLAARVAKRLVPGPLAAEAFTAALVHDVGKIVLAQGLPGPFGEVIREAKATGRPVYALEEEHLGTTHAAVGAYLMGVWGLPFTIVESVGYHHHPTRIGAGACEVLAAVHVANGLVRGADGTGTEKGELLDLEFLERAGLAAALPEWRLVAEEELRNVES